VDKISLSLALFVTPPCKTRDILFFIIIFNNIGDAINNMEYNVRQVLPETSLIWINRQEIRQRDNSNRLSRLGAARRISSPAPGSALRYS